MAKKKARRRRKTAMEIADERSRKEQLQWQAEQDLATLRRAQEIAEDPSRRTAAERIAKEEQEALAKITNRGGIRRAKKKGNKK